MKRGDRVGADRRINLLAGPQYRVEGHTITFRRRPQVGDPITCTTIAEMDGAPPQFGQMTPTALAKEIFLCKEFPT